jgi:hypothetical protein
MDMASVPQGRRPPPMCYTRSKAERDLEKETRWATESRLMEEEARQRHEDHHRSRRAQEEKKPLTEKVKEMIGTGR